MPEAYDVSRSAVGLAPIGAPVARVESVAKVTGAARFAADEALNGTLHAVLVTTPHSKGRITAIDDTAARKVRGVRLVLTHENMPKLDALKPVSAGGVAQNGVRQLGQADIRFAGEIVAMVVAETMEGARRAAELVDVSVEPAERSVASMFADDAPEPRPVPEKAFEPIVKGDVEAALGEADQVVEATYTTPTQHHNPIELYFTSVEWVDGGLTAYVPSQWVAGTRGGLATVFELPTEKVRVVSHYVGGGFGSKATVMDHTIIAAQAARMLRSPVKLYVGRDQMFTVGSHRPESRHTLRIGAKDGKLSAIDHVQDSQTSTFDTFFLPGTEQTTRMYDWQAIRGRETVVPTDTNTPGFMRAPAETPALFALESAVDEMAVALGVDPVELRLRSDAKDREPVEGKPWTSRDLDTCLREGAAEFGWANRPPEVRAQQRGDWLFGQGVATALYPTYTRPGSAEVRLGSDLSCRVSAAGHELGGGTYTILAQIASEALGIPLEQIRVELGSSDLPVNGVAGGSTQTASIGPAVLDACRKVRDRIAEAAVGRGGALEGADPKTIELRDGKVIAGDRSAELGKAFDGVPYGVIEERGQWIPEPASGNSLREYYRSGAGKQVGFITEDFARAAFGAQFAEVAVNRRTGEVRVPRLVGAFACGRILNERTARSQLSAGMIWGVGSVLHEATEIDRRHARFLNTDLGEYLVPVNADVPSVEVVIVPQVDEHVNPLGAKGIGEIGITGVNAAIANAVYHATGRRLRSVPIRMEQLLGA